MDEHLHYPSRQPDAAAAQGEPLGVAILGGGPAGLTAADLAGRRGAQATLVEGDVMVGGISRTVERDGYRFALGGHRFFTKSGPARRLGEDALGAPSLVRPRLSRIYHNGQFFSYPLT